MTTHKGSCHCGQVAIEVEGGIDGGMTCNCSICGRRGSVLWFVPRDRMTLKTPEDDAASYTFNHHVIRHRFCPKCGIHVWGEGTDPKGNAIAAVNLRCIDGIDLATIPTQAFDGRSL